MAAPLSCALAAFCFTTVAFAQSTCPAVGVTVDASGGRLGDTWRVNIDASPTVLGVLGLDFAPGPVPTPLGTICLGLTPGLLTAAFLTDPAGTATFTGLLPPLPAFAGIDVYAAASTLEPAQPRAPTRSSRCRAATRCCCSRWARRRVRSAVALLDRCTS